MKIIEKIAPAWFDYEGAGFLCKPLTAADRVAIFGIAQDEDLGHFYSEIVRRAVADWRGFTNEAGEPVEFSPRALDDLFADGTRAPLLMSLGAFILERANVGKDTEVGFTSGPQPT